MVWGLFGFLPLNKKLGVSPSFLFVHNLCHYLVFHEPLVHEPLNV